MLLLCVLFTIQNNITNIALELKEKSLIYFKDEEYKTKAHLVIFMR